MDDRSIMAAGQTIYTHYANSSADWQFYIIIIIVPPHQRERVPNQTSSVLMALLHRRSRDMPLRQHNIFQRLRGGRGCGGTETMMAENNSSIQQPSSSSCNVNICSWVQQYGACQIEKAPNWTSTNTIIMMI